MKVAITGASGFAGTNLVPYLQKEGVEVLPLSRSNRFAYELINSDYLDNNSIDAVVHLAGKAHDLRKSVDPNSYFEANTILTQTVFNSFLSSKAKTFIYISSVKAAADHAAQPLTETAIPQPSTDYGKSKLAAEQYLRSKIIPGDKKVYILRPCMMHGPGNKGNLNLLYKVIAKNIPWPLGSFNNKKSFLSIENFCYTVYEMLSRDDIPEGEYNVADSELLSTNELINIMMQELNKKSVILKVPKRLISFVAKLGDLFHLPINNERLQKLTESFIVSNKKLIDAIGHTLPVSAEEGIRATIRAFSDHDK